jgi:hypothetical protein
MCLCLCVCVCDTYMGAVPCRSFMQRLGAAHERHEMFMPKHAMSSLAKIDAVMRHVCIQIEIGSMHSCNARFTTRVTTSIQDCRQVPCEIVTNTHTNTACACLPRSASRFLLQMTWRFCSGRPYHLLCSCCLNNSFPWPLVSPSRALCCLSETQVPRLPAYAHAAAKIRCVRWW